MRRDNYKIYSPGQIGKLTLSNRLVRSATWDPLAIFNRRMSDEVLDIYRRVALGGVGLIITGDFPVITTEMLESDDTISYDDVAIGGLEKLADAVHSSRANCKIVAQLAPGYLVAGPSEISSPFMRERLPALSGDEIQRIIDSFVKAIVKMKEYGFDGVQFHAAHGGLLSQFLSPYTNRRDDAYGGSVENRVRIVRDIVSKAREKIGDFPILIKMNCTDYVEGGLDIDSFPELAVEIEQAGVDALEVSGGMWDCLVRPQEELGFRPVPAPESHTRIKSPDRQSYFLRYAEKLALGIPVILVGGNRDVERLEEILQQGKVDFIALCRPLISEPDLPNRWLEGRGSDGTDCISCNSCVYDMYVNLERGTPGIVTCVLKHNRQQVKAAQHWLNTWVKENTITH